MRAAQVGLSEGDAPEESAGEPVRKLQGRADLLIKIPRTGVAYPIVAQTPQYSLIRFPRWKTSPSAARRNADHRRPGQAEA